MKFSKEQFDEIGPFYTNDFAIDCKDQEVMRRLFNALPSNIQAKAIAWGCNDTEFNDEVFEFLCRNQLGMTTKEYYDSDVFKRWKTSQEPIAINFSKLEDERITIG